MQPDLGDLLRRADESDAAAVDQSFALLDDELHRLASRHLSRGGSSLALGSTTLDGGVPLPACLLHLPYRKDHRADESGEHDPKALTDPRARDLDALIPARVPSALPVDR